MKIEEYLRAKLEPELRKALEEKSKEELIESIINLTISCCAITVNSFELSARLHKEPLAVVDQQALLNPFPDWSEAMFKGAAQVCELRQDIIDESYKKVKIVDTGCCTMGKTAPKVKLKVKPSNKK